MPLVDESEVGYCAVSDYYKVEISTQSIKSKKMRPTDAVKPNTEKLSTIVEAEGSTLGARYINCEPGTQLKLLLLKLKVFMNIQTEFLV